MHWLHNCLPFTLFPTMRYALGDLIWPTGQGFLEGNRPGEVWANFVLLYC